MHINYVMWHLGKSGGAITFLELGKRLIKKGHKVTITSFWGLDDPITPEPKPAWALDSPVEFIPVFTTTVLLNRSKGGQAISEIVPEYLPVEVMISNIPKSDISVATYFPSAYAVYLANKGKVNAYHMQHFEALFFRSTVLPDLRNPPPLCDEVRDALENVMYFSFRELVNTRLAEMSYLLPLEKIANSNWLKKTVKEHFDVESTVILHGVQDGFRPMPEIIKPEKKRIVALGKTNVYWKGNDTLAAAMNILLSKRQDIELYLFGTDVDPQCDCPFKYVTGLQPASEELNHFYSMADVVVNSGYWESFPLMPLEGMACGTPVVSTQFGVEDYAKHEENCLIVPPRNPEMMAYAIERLLNDKELSKKLVANGLETVKQFTWDKTADKVEQFFLTKLEEKEKKEKDG